MSKLYTITFDRINEQKNIDCMTPLINFSMRCITVYIKRQQPFIYDFLATALM